LPIIKSKWLDSKSPEERQELFKKVRIIAPEFKEIAIQDAKGKYARRMF